MAYKKSYQDQDLFKNLLKINDKKKTEFLEKMREFLTAHNFFKKNIDEKTDFLLSEKGLKSIIACAEQNLQLVEIASVFDITQRQFIDLKNSHPAIYDAFDLGYAKRDMTVINSMYKLASGFSIIETETHKMEMGNRQTVKTIEKERFIPPNVYAQQYIINNRKQFEYKRDTDKNQVPESNMFKIELSFGDSEEDE